MAMINPIDTADSDLVPEVLRTEVRAMMACGYEVQMRLPRPNAMVSESMLYARNAERGCGWQHWHPRSNLNQALDLAMWVGCTYRLTKTAMTLALPNGRLVEAPSLGRPLSPMIAHFIVASLVAATVGERGVLTPH